MLKENIDLYYFDQNYNCAESLIHAANDYYHLDLEEKGMKLLAAYGGGMQTGNTCGALLAAMSVLALRYVDKKAHESTDIKPVSEELIRRFSEKCSNCLACREIKPQVFQPERRCVATVYAACDALEEVIDWYK